MSRDRNNGVRTNSQGMRTRDIKPSHAANLMLRKLPPNERVHCRQDNHFNEGGGRKRGATVEQIQDIRDRQASGEVRGEVRLRYPDISESSFNNIWLGTTAAGIVGKVRPKKSKKSLLDKSW